MQKIGSKFIPEISNRTDIFVNTKTQNYIIKKMKIQLNVIEQKPENFIFNVIHIMQILLF